LAHFFGAGDYADVFQAALKVPNFLQTLLGDGVMSGSLIPVYARLRAEGRHAEADEVASATAQWMALLNTLIVGVSIVLAPFVIPLLLPGFAPEKQILTVQLAQMLFPGIGALALSAWCLGVLNSHGRFFLSYVAPVIWNLSIIAALIYFGTDWFGQALPPEDLVIKTTWGVVVGSFLQLLVQVPSVLGTLKWKWGLASSSQHLKQVARSFLPIVSGRGVVQLSAYADNLVASLLPSGALATLAYAQTLYMLPISLFGMSISASELPAMSSALGTREQIAEQLRERLRVSSARVAYFILPTCGAFLIFGADILSALFGGGRFDAQAVFASQWALIGYSLALYPTTQSRLLVSAFYALKDARTPFRASATRVISASLIGAALALYLKSESNGALHASVLGLTLASGMTSWMEWLWLRQKLRVEIPNLAGPAAWIMKPLMMMFIALALAYSLKVQLKDFNELFRSGTTLFIFGVIYLIGTHFARVPTAREVLRRIRLIRN
jgi:putative peptidoglycan lipid II flippase